jgi:hypothetical protein
MTLPQFSEGLHGLSKEDVYNPANERQVNFYAIARPVRDIKDGEELLVDDCLQKIFHQID